MESYKKSIVGSHIGACLTNAHGVVAFLKMADEGAERPEDFPTNLALDSRKQKEFEDKVKTISSKVKDFSL